LPVGGVVELDPDRRARTRDGRVALEDADFETRRRVGHQASATEDRARPMRHRIGTELDVLDSEAVGRTLRQLRPEVVINCAAFTRVDDAERDLARARMTLIESRAELLTSAAALAFAVGDVAPALPQ